jgi:hypothetical protein
MKLLLKLHPNIKKSELNDPLNRAKDIGGLSMQVD